MTSTLPAFRDLAGWDAFKQAQRAALWRLLGDMEPTFTPASEVLSREERGAYTMERIAFDNGAGATVYGYVLIPNGVALPAPAILYQHAHGGNYPRGKNELFQPPGQLESAPGVALVEAGYVVLAIDAYAFGERRQQGPGGSRESGLDTEWALFKKLLWEGKTLWGQMVRDDLLALNYLLSRSEVDPARVGTTGMSLGGSRATWLAALDDRIRVAVPVAQMTRYRDFAAQGDFSLHSIYYYVPAILKHGIDMEGIVALTAPRAQRIIIGDADPLSPFAGVQTIIEAVRPVYALHGAEDRFQIDIYPGVAHAYTPAMFASMRAAFREWL